MFVKKFGRKLKNFSEITCAKFYFDTFIATGIIYGNAK